MPVEQVVRSVCNYKQAYTQFGGLRPFGTAFLFAGETIPYHSIPLLSMQSIISVVMQEQSADDDDDDDAATPSHRIRLEVRIPALPDGSIRELQRMEGDGDR